MTPARTTAATRATMTTAVDEAADVVGVTTITAGVGVEAGIMTAEDIGTMIELTEESVENAVNVEAMGGTMTEVDGVGMTIGGIERNPAPGISVFFHAHEKLALLLFFFVCI
jgi:hypothetical protein